MPEIEPRKTSLKLLKDHFLKTIFVPINTIEIILAKSGTSQLMIFTSSGNNFWIMSVLFVIESISCVNMSKLLEENNCH